MGGDQEQNRELAEDYPRPYASGAGGGSRGGGGLSAATPQKESVMSSHLEELRMNAGELLDLVDRLESKLQPVLTPQTTDGNKEESVPEPGIRITSYIAFQNARLRSSKLRLARIIKELEI